MLVKGIIAKLILKNYFEIVALLSIFIVSEDVSLLYGPDVTEVYFEKRAASIDSAVLPGEVEKGDEGGCAPTLYELNFVTRHKNLKSFLVEGHISVVAFLLVDGFDHDLG